MADTVTTNIFYQDAKQLAVYLTGVSDGTGETTVVKVDKSTLTDVNGAEPAALDIERVDWTVTTFVKVTMQWDHAADSPALTLAGTGHLDFTGVGYPFGGRVIRDAVRTSGLTDPKTADSTGDLTLTSAATANGTYSIVLWLHKRPA